ncbi:MAG: hypothetical protein KGR98_07995, partial [Verrucomicrobia bacterium]|nr:hypothetical protein [Verrucomicrobiota bacterium]
MIERLSTWLMPPRPAPAERVQRIAAMQLHIVIPAKLGVAIIALHYLFSGWFSEEVAVYILVVGLLRKFFLL